jgi:Domain of unknown function (DUF305)
VPSSASCSPATGERSSWSSSAWRSARTPRQPPPDELDGFHGPGHRRATPRHRNENAGNARHANTGNDAHGRIDAGHGSNSRELTTLSTSSGRQTEILFLQLMIRHHQGGVDMAADAARRAANRNVKEAALQMVKDQTDEIQLMMVMLNQRGGTTLPYPTR